jgi:hypothetical protein
MSEGGPPSHIFGIRVPVYREWQKFSAQGFVEGVPDQTDVTHQVLYWTDRWGDPVDYWLCSLKPFVVLIVAHGTPLVMTGLAVGGFPWNPWRHIRLLV